MCRGEIHVQHHQATETQLSAKAKLLLPRLMMTQRWTSNRRVNQTVFFVSHFAMSLSSTASTAAHIFDHNLSLDRSRATT